MMHHPHHAPGSLTETEVWQSSRAQQQATGPQQLYDRWGFRRAEDDASATRPEEAGPLDGFQQARRVRKWAKMLGKEGAGLEAYLRRKPGKLKSRARKGIPTQLRGLAWFALSGGHRSRQHPYRDGVHAIPDALLPQAGGR